jgi:ATP-dependent Clp protease ATP-binding subunit ClpX
MDGVTLSFEDDALDYIVEKAIEFKLGARGLRSIAETIMMDAMYEVPSGDQKEMSVTLNFAREKMEKSRRISA